MLESAKICDAKSLVLATRPPQPISRAAWGLGEEITFPTARAGTEARESLFFDQDGVLVGYLIAFADRLSLDPYPVLRDTLAQLRPRVQFFLSLASLPSRGPPETTTLYMTGDEKSTTEYLIQGAVKSGHLLMAAVSIDPYQPLLSPYRKDMLARLPRAAARARDGGTEGAGADDADPFRALQQFARGETALLGYCGDRNEALAADAYARALEHGIKTQSLLAEAHHKLGLSWRALGDLARARTQLEQSLAILPDRPDVLNNLGQVYQQLGDRRKALEALERAVALKPNYPLARFNLAEAYEALNVRRAIEEYETYLVLAEGVPGESERMKRARQRLKALTR